LRAKCSVVIVILKGKWQTVETFNSSGGIGVFLRHATMVRIAAEVTPPLHAHCPDGVAEADRRMATSNRKFRWAAGYY
jgi:hypothetical protein